MRLQSIDIHVPHKASDGYVNNAPENFSYGLSFDEFAALRHVTRCRSALLLPGTSLTRSSSMPVKIPFTRFVRASRCARACAASHPAAALPCNVQDDTCPSCAPVPVRPVPVLPNGPRLPTAPTCARVRRHFRGGDAGCKCARGLQRHGHVLRPDRSRCERA